VAAAKVAGLDLRRRPTLGESARLLGVELSADFVKGEMAMLAAIRSGEALAHHLEPSYLEALIKASSVRPSYLQAPTSASGSAGDESDEWATSSKSAD
jgi:hypothetical protein